MAEKKNKSAKPFNFGDAGLLKQTEETVVKAYERIEQQEQSGVGAPVPSAATPLQPTPNTPIIETHTITDFPETKIAREEMQNINVPIPVSLHQRLKMIGVTKRQSMKQLVVNALREYVDRQEGK
jgi:hypothetical protein